MSKKAQPQSPGVCYLVGAGPGDPGLLTLRGRECLSRADVVVYDYLSNAELLAHAPVQAERIYAGKTAGRHALRQEETNALLVKLTREGKRVVRLKGGDPFLFGRGGEEAAELAAAGLPFEVVPGVTSAIGGPAYAGIPVTHRASNAVLTIFTGHEEPGKETSGIDYAAIASAPGTKVMLMGDRSSRPDHRATRRGRNGSRDTCRSCPLGDDAAPGNAHGHPLHDRRPG